MDENIENLGEFSVKQLKNNLKATLQKSGVLGTVKAQIRQEFINSLSSKTHNKAVNIDISDRILYSAVFQLLNDRKMVNSISVFLAETGLDPKNTLLSPNDLISMIKFNDLHKILESLNADPSGSTLEGTNLSPNMLQQKRFTILDLLMHFCTTITENNKEISTQTESAGPSAREALEESLHELRKSFLVGQKGREGTNTTIQERMIAYQRDCERRVQNDVAMQVAHMRETEITKVRLEEASKARTEIDAMRKRLELDYARRLQALIDSEASMARRISDQEQAAQRSLYDARQIMQREIDDLRSRESAAARKMDLEAQGVKMLELRLKESLSAIEVREADILRREHAMEEKRVIDIENARKEALLRVQNEFDLLTRERSSFLLERANFYDQQAIQTGLIESAKLMKEELKQTREKLLQSEEEIQIYQQKYQRIELKKQEEEKEIKMMISQVDASLAKFSLAEQIVALIRHNSALEVKLATYSDAHTLQQRYEEKQKECITAQGEVLELRALLETERKRIIHDQDEAQRCVASERAKAAACAHKLEEMRQLLKDKTQAMETMRVQLVRAEARSSVGEEGRGSGSGAYIPRANRSTAGSTDRRALEFLRRSGHFAEEDAAENRKVEQLSGAFLDSVLQRLSALPPAASPYMAYQAYSQIPPAVPVHTLPITTTAAQPYSGTYEQTQQQQQQVALDQQRRAAEEMSAALQQEQRRAAELTAQVEQQKLASARLALEMERNRLEAAEAEKQAASSRRSNVTVAPNNTYERPPSGKSSGAGSSAGISTSWMSVDAVRLQPGSSASSISSVGRSESRLGDSTRGDATGAGSTIGFESDSDTGSRPEPTDGKFTYKKPASLSERSESEYSFDSDSATDSHPEPTAGKFIYQPSVTATTSNKVDSVSDNFEEVNEDEESQPESTDGKFTYSPSSKATSKPASVGDFESDTENESKREPTDGKFTYLHSVASESNTNSSTKENETVYVDGTNVRDAEEEARLVEKEKERQLDIEKQEKLQADQRYAQELLEKEEEIKQQRLKEEREEQLAEENRLRIIKEEEEYKETQRIQAENERLKKEQEDHERKEKEQKEEQERVEQEERERLETERREAEEAMAEETEAAKKAAAEEEEQRRQKEADEAEIEEARARVLARRRERQRLDGGLVSSSLPTSLQSAAAGAAASSSTGDGDSRADSAASYSATSALAGMQGGVSTSLDSAVGMRPQRNLFGNNPSFQSLQDSDSSSEGRLEVGDVSDDQEADRSTW